MSKILISILLSLIAVSYLCNLRGRRRLNDGHDNIYKSEKQFYDLSNWKEENVQDLRKMAIEMRKNKEKVLYLKKKSTEYYEKVDMKYLLEKGDFTTERLRTSRRRLSDIEDPSKRWDAEGEAMSKEFYNFFMDLQKNSSPTTKETNENLKITNQKSNQATINEKISSSTQKDARSLVTYPNVNCTDPNADLPCPSLSLPQLCDKYNNGSFEACYQECKPSYCCIHDSTSQVIAPNCVTEPNCKHWSWCYIIWWKLADTIGPQNFYGVEQNDDFYDVDDQYIKNEFNFGTDIPFFNQLFGHFKNTDDDPSDPWFEDPLNWGTLPE